ncbi:MAG: ACT domain-containing protein [Planctomycetota bacterium]
MTRRFLTAEDVARAAGTEIVVEPETLVTPQAEELAASRGMVIRTPSGPYTVPPPDRGPDADTAAAHRAFLPEPIDSVAVGQTAIVTAVGANKPGVLASITAKIAELGGNVEDVSQKVIGSYFHIILTVRVEGQPFEVLHDQLVCMGSPEELAISVMNERAFRFMHRV